ncbi:hypothetical protein HBI12_197020 [Parastagonospora nodorum]|nr:hypothetical protein HBI12_197020 [Parastagonospora nodorum]
MTGSKQTRLPLTLPVPRSNNGQIASERGSARTTQVSAYQSWLAYVVAGSSDNIRDGTNRRTWDWEDDDDELLQVFRIEFGLSWDVIAEFLFIGMRPSQCGQRLEKNKAIHLCGAGVLTDDQWKKFNTPGAMVFY